MANIINSIYYGPYNMADMIWAILSARTSNLNPFNTFSGKQIPDVGPAVKQIDTVFLKLECYCEIPHFF